MRTSINPLNLIRLVAVLSLLILGLYCLHPRWDQLPIFAKILYSALALAGLALVWRPSGLNLKQAPRLSLLGILALWAFVLYLGVEFSVDLEASFTLIPWYLWGIGLGLAGLSVLPSPMAEPENYSSQTRRAWALFFVAASLLRDTLFIWFFGINAQSDSNYYVNSLRTLFFGGDGFDQPSYLPLQFFHALLNSADNPWPVVIAQVLISAGVLGALVYYLSKRQASFAILWGFFSLADLVWAYNSRTLMTESLFINAFLLAMLLVMTHIERRKTLPQAEVFAAGLFYGSVLLIRISGFPLFLPLMLVYGVIRRHWRTPLLILLGVAILFAGAEAFNRWQKTFAQNVNPHALTWGYTMFYYQTFSPDNGPASARLDERLQECNLSYENYTRESSNAFAFLGLASCLNEEELGLLPKAYQEMMRANTLNYSKAVLNEAAIFTTLDVQSTVLLLNAEIIDSTCYTSTWCLDLPRHYRFELDAFLPFIAKTRYLQQPYFLLLPPAYFGEAYQLNAHTFKAFTTREAPHRNLPALAGALMWMGFVLVVSRGMDRWWLVAVSLFIWNQIGTSVTGQFFFPRLGMALSPFYSFWAAWFWLSLGKFLLPRAKFPPFNIQPFLYAAAGMCLLFSAYFAWQSQDLSAYGGDLLISRVQDDLKDRPGFTIFNPALNNFDWRLPNPFILLRQDTPAITQWREDKAPGHLKAAGIEYILVDHIWFSFVDEATAQLFSDPDYYLLEQEWSEGNQHIYLYRVVGSQLGPGG